MNSKSVLALESLMLGNELRIGDLKYRIVKPGEPIKKIVSHHDFASDRYQLVNVAEMNGRTGARREVYVGSEMSLADFVKKMEMTDIEDLPIIAASDDQRDPPEISKAASALEAMMAGERVRFGDNECLILRPGDKIKSVTGESLSLIHI